MKYILFIIFLFLCTKSVAQTNLVMNPSLEDFSQCPFVWDEIKFASHWMSLDSAWAPPDWANDSPGVPDYCNACATDTNLTVGIPGGYSYDRVPRTGNGMAQVQMFYDEENSYQTYLRDYLQGHLTNMLIAGQSYCVSFYVALEGAGYAINNIGAYFDNGTIDTTHRYGLPQTQYIPQVLNTSIILDTFSIPDILGAKWQGNWVRIEGSFIANGTERLITIGNFSDKAHTRILPLYDTTGRGFVGEFTWYLVDDISVFRSDASAYAGPSQIFPSGSVDSLIIGDTLDTYLPTYWYAAGVLIDSNKASIKVKPSVTTQYVVALNKCGGEVSYDTAVITVENLGDEVISKCSYVNIFPNPAHDVINITFGEGCEVVVYDMVGRSWGRHTMASNMETIDISGMEIGVYMVEVTDGATGEKVVRRVVKE